MAEHDWPRPLVFLAACLRQDGGAEARALAPSLTSQDWQRALWLAINRHRVGPQFHQAVRHLDPPEDVATALARHTEQNAIRALGQIAETHRVMQAIDAAEPVIFKGWPLSERLFGTPSMRHIGDMDIVVDPKHMTEMCEIMAGLGYVIDAEDGPVDRPMQASSAKALATESKHVTFARTGGHMVEMHWRLLPYRGWPDVLSLPGAAEVRAHQTGRLRVLSDQANMLYLPVHGGLHLWTRLKWLADIAPLAGMRGPDGLAADMELAREIGLELPVGIGIRLSARLFGSPLPPGMSLERTSALERFMLNTIARDDMIPVVSSRYRFWSRINAMRLCSSLNQFVGVVRYDTLRRLRTRLAAIAP